MDLNRYNIEVFGKEFTISSREEEKNVYKIVNYLDAKMREVSSQTGVIDFYNVLLLTSIVLVNNYLTLLSDCNKKEKDLKYAKKIKELINLIDSSLNKRDFL